METEHNFLEEHFMNILENRKIDNSLVVEPVSKESLFEKLSREIKDKSKKNKTIIDITKFGIKYKYTKDKFSSSLMFENGDIKNPLHDEIVLWIFDNYKEIFQDISLEFKNFKLIKKNIEEPICSQKNIKKHGTWVTIKEPIGAIDCIFKFEYIDKDDNKKKILSCIIEVKTNIDSNKIGFTLGEALRQINFYEQYYLNDNVDCTYLMKTIVCPSDRYLKYLKDVGITFIKYEPDKYKNNSSVLVAEQSEATPPSGNGILQ